MSARPDPVGRPDWPGRVPFGYERTDWGKPPFSPETLREMERRVRVYMRGNPNFQTYERRLRAVCEIALLLLEHNACFDEVAP